MKLGFRVVFLVFLLSFYSVISSVDKFSEQLFIPLKLLFKIVCYICTFSLSFLVVTVLVQIIFIYFDSEIDVSVLIARLLIQKRRTEENRDE